MQSNPTVTNIYSLSETNEMSAEAKPEDVVMILFPGVYRIMVAPQAAIWKWWLEAINN